MLCIWHIPFFKFGRTGILKFINRNPIMYKHYFTLAIRHLQKHRLFSGIKIIGLTIATASCLLIGLYILHELNYDSMHENAGRIIKANMEYRFAGETVMANVCGNKAAPAFTRDFPEIESGVRLMKYSEIIKTGDQIFEEENLFYGDSTFFSIFSFPRGIFFLSIQENY